MTKMRSVFPLLALLASTVLLTGCDARPQSELSGQSLLDAFTEDGPEIGTVSDSLLSTAKTAEKDRNYARALGFYSQLADKEPENAEYQIGVAENLRRIGEHDKAIARYNAILQKTPNHLTALEGKGLTYIAKAEFVKAGPFLEKVILQDPKRWRALNGVGLLFVAKGLPNEALSYFDAALQNNADSFVVLNNSGLTQALAGDYERAIQTLQRATRSSDREKGEIRQAELNLALVYGISGKMDAAEQTALRHLPEEAVHNNLGFYAYLADNHELAKAYLNSALSNSKTFYKRAWENLESMDKIARN